MNQVQLQPDGRLHAEGRALVDPPLARLGHQIVLADGCRVRTYFHLIEIYPDLLRLNEFLPLLLDQYRACPADGCHWDRLARLELTKTVEMVGYPGAPRLDIYTSLGGIDPQQPDAPEPIQMLALAVLLDMPLTLGRLRHVIFGDRVETFTFDTVYTLFEFIDSIAWELSFHGTPRECMLRR
ncbi:MAG: hypothetical protein WAU91_05295 [Desulfatitalea sp.]